MTFLTAEDIKKIFSMEDAIETNKECYRAFSDGEYEVPLRTVISGSAGDFLFMPAYSEKLGMVGMKNVNIIPGNTSKGKPASIGQIMLIDGETGELVAVMDGTYVTALRTAAASGAAFDLLGVKDAKIGAMIGTGSQAMCQLEALLTVRDLDEVRVAARNFEKTKAFVEKAGIAFARFGTKIVTCSDPDEAVAGADLVTLVTTSDKPVCSAENFKAGCTISAVGAYTYDMQELDPAVFAGCDKIYFDSADAVLAESGDILRPLDEGLLTRDRFTGDIGDFIAGRIPGRESDDEIIIFENVGIGALDLAAAAEIYKKMTE